MAFYYVFMLIGVIIMLSGVILWRKQKITFIHSYHYTKVKKEDIRAYTKAMGQSVIGIGASVFLMQLIWAINKFPSFLGAIVFVIGFIASMIAFYIVQKKYNGGVF